MAHKCNKCGGIGYIEKFSGVENGTCFKCEGTGVTLTASERSKILAECINNHDALLAKQVGVSLDVFQAYTRGPVPKHPNGCSFSIQEFEVWLNETREAA